MAGVRGGAAERGVRAPVLGDQAHGPAPDPLPRSCHRHELRARPADGPADRGYAGCRREDRLRFADRADRRFEPRRAGGTRRGVQSHGGAAPGVLFEPRAEGRGADSGARDGTQRAGREESRARGCEPAQVGVPGQHVARAADAAERDHRLLAGAARADVRRGEREAGGVPRRHPLVGQPPALADQRRPRPVQGRGRAGRARARAVLAAGRARARRRDGARARDEGRRPGRARGRSRRRRRRRRRAPNQAGRSSTCSRTP